MTKADLIAKVAELAEMKKTEAEKAVAACLDAIKEILQNDQKLTITGFGTFEVVQRKERKGRNPQTGEEMIIPAAKVVKFKPGKLLKEAVKQ
ncbi:HU family DNA-binding protein [Desulfothermus okinawensis JCM 13304]